MHDPRPFWQSHGAAALAAVAILFSGCGQPPPPAPAKPSGTQNLVRPAPGEPTLLVFSRTQGFRHDSIPDGISALSELARAGGFGLDATEDPAEFSDEKLSPYAAVVFLSTTGDVLDAAGQASFERYIAAGRGYIGIHAAADCEYDWPFYGDLVGAYFHGHSLVVPAAVKPEPVSHPSLTGLPSPWQRTDEWYGFQKNPRGAVTVLLSVDESSYAPGQGQMGTDHPVAWLHEYGGGRAFYTSLGHTSESFAEPLFLSHLQGGVAWASKLSD